MNKLKTIYSSAYAASLSIFITVVVTIGAELSMPFKGWLASFTGHHWITKSWLSLISFVVFFIVFKRRQHSVDESQTRKALFVLEFLAIVGFLVILGFYLYEFLVK